MSSENNSSEIKMRNNRPFSTVEEMFNQLGSLSGLTEWESHGVRVDVQTSDDNVIVTADLPGYTSEDIDVTIDGNHLTLTAERTSDSNLTDEDEGSYMFRERSTSAVSRGVTLPVGVDTDEVEATYKNGVLTIVFEWMEDEKSSGKSIEVE